jgi:hypothetical protein
MKPIHFQVTGPDGLIRDVTLAIHDGTVKLHMGTTVHKEGWTFMSDFISSGKYKFYKTPKKIQEKVSQLCAAEEI